MVSKLYALMLGNRAGNKVIESDKRDYRRGGKSSRMRERKINAKTLCARKPENDQSKCAKLEEFFTQMTPRVQPDLLCFDHAPATGDRVEKRRSRPGQRDARDRKNCYAAPRERSRVYQVSCAKKKPRNLGKGGGGGGGVARRLTATAVVVFRAAIEESVVEHAAASYVYGVVS